MARYVGSAVFVALAASIYAGVAQSRVDDGREAADALASGLAWSCAVLAFTCALGIGMGLLGRYRQHRAHELQTAAATASHAHTVPVPAPAPST
jgi:hypothetical protein